MKIRNFAPHIFAMMFVFGMAITSLQAQSVDNDPPKKAKAESTATVNSEKKKEKSCCSATASEEKKSCSGTEMATAGEAEKKAEGKSCCSKK
jgi:hypothetical protein